MKILQGDGALNTSTNDGQCSVFSVALNPSINV